jgi:hypothetical protein
MPEAAYSIDRDLEEARALADHLIPYVYENELYGSIGGMFGSGSMPRLTIGALLERLHRLHALEGQMSAQQKTQLSQIDQQKEKARDEWTIHYNDKLVQEAKSRLKMIERYFSDCEEDPRTCAPNYIPEANRRTIVADIVQELARTGGAAAEVESAAQKVDTRLRRYAQPSEFIWAGALQAAYPQDQYWWLYAKPPRTGAK